MGSDERPDEAERSQVANDVANDVADRVAPADGVAVVETALVGFAPIVRVDAARREIELCATSEAVDSHGTIFDYEASKDAFTRWVGNVREMHGRSAVGRRVAVRCDDVARRIYVRIRVSRGARDTWEKVLDGTLRGASIGASGVVWQRQRRRIAGEQRAVQVATRYDLVELSLVDNPSNPDALGISFVRGAMPDIALLDVLDDHEDRMGHEGDDERDAPVKAPEPNVSSGADKGVDQTAQGRLHDAARAVMSGCGCPLCRAADALLDEPSTAAERAEADILAQGVDQPLARALAAGLSQHGAQIVALAAGVQALVTTIEASLRRIASDLGGLHHRVESMEQQPQTGGPSARPVAKPSAFATRGHAGYGGYADAPSASERYRALESLAGAVTDPQVQVAIAAELIRLQQASE